MLISRKQFIKNAGLLLGGAALFRQKIFDEIIVKDRPPTCLETLFSSSAFEDLNNNYQERR